MLSLFLPHLIARGPAPASIVLVSSGLAIVHIPRCANYCATKAALHSLAWTLRSQLSSAPETRHVRVIEVVPPAVQTELHSQQEDLVHAGQTAFALPLEPYADETWAALQGDQDEILATVAKQRFGHVEDEKRKVFVTTMDFMKKMGIPA